MAYNKQYKDFLEISPNFESVVDIDADKRNQNLWREYIVGDDMENLVDVLCQSLGNEAPDARRSFWVHGSYGQYILGKPANGLGNRAIYQPAAS